MKRKIAIGIGVVLAALGIGMATAPDAFCVYCSSHYCSGPNSCNAGCVCVSGPGEPRGQCYGVNAIPDGLEVMQ